VNKEQNAFGKWKQFCKNRAGSRSEMIAKGIKIGCSWFMNGCIEPGTVVHTYNSNYLGRRNRRIAVQGQPGQMLELSQKTRCGGACL
jgi:hypothetical protein